MPSVQTLKFLPQHNGNWYTAFRLIPAWLKDDKDPEEYSRPWMIFIVDLDTGAIINLNLMIERPAANQAYEFLTQSMVTPARNSITSQRPRIIYFEDESLAVEIEPRLKELKIQTIYDPQEKTTDEIVENLLPFVLQGQIPLPGLLKQHGVKLDLVTSIFKSATRLWEVKPWNILDNEDILEVWVGEQNKPYYISLMGSGGMEFGFAVFKSQNELQQFFVELATRITKIPTKGRHVFLYNPPPMISFDDMDLVEEHHLPIPSIKHFPTPLLFKPDDIYRPSATMLRWYEAFMLVLPDVINELQPELAPLEKQYVVNTVKGETTVKVKYPAFSKKKINFWKNDGALKMMAEMIRKASEA
jgi:hypothetical protein